MLLLDVWVLKHTTAALAIELGQTVSEAANQASALVGYYRAAQTFALVPYQLILSVTFVMFPLVSRATAEGDVVATRMHTSAALRFSLIALFLMACPIAGSAEALIRLAFGAKFLPGATTLSVLVFGQLSLALFVIVATVLTGAGKPAVVAKIGAVALLLMFVANWSMVRAVGIGQHTLSAAAFATSLGPLLALVLALLVLKRQFDVRLPLPTLLRCMLAAAAGFLVARLIPQHHALLAPPALSAAALAYLAALALTGELKRDDLTRLLGALLRKKPAVA
jgi:stage V sporulation protein B